MRTPRTAPEYAEQAIALGAVHAVPFVLEDIAFDSRTMLKCMFGCSDWGKGPTCPSRPGSPSPWDYRRIFSEYRWGIIVHAHDKKMSQDISFAIERDAFLDGHPFAFSLSDCACCWCVWEFVDEF